MGLMVLRLFAHADESHGGGVEAAQHFLKADPWIVVPVSLAVIIAIPSIIYKFSHSFNAAVLIALLELFLVGVLAYAVLPVLAIICISLGFVLALTLVFGSLIG